MLLAPGAKDGSWKGPRAKAAHRSLALGRTHIGPSGAVALYNHRIHPVWGYVAQLLPVFSRINSEGLKHFHKSVHLAPGALSMSAALSLPLLGLEAFRSALLLHLSGLTLTVFAL